MEQIGIIPDIEAGPTLTSMKERRHELLYRVIAYIEQKN
jgi:hypothetical protein